MKEMKEEKEKERFFLSKYLNGEKEREKRGNKEKGKKKIFFYHF